MRDLALITLFTALVPMSFLRPHVGVLGWCWISVMTPHHLAWGWTSGLPLNQFIALATFAGWVVSPREPKRVPFGLTFWLLVAFTAWFTLSSIYSLSPENTWTLWDRYFKVMVTGVVVMSLMRDRPR